MSQLLHICNAYFRGDRNPIEGRYYTLTDPINAPTPLRCPPVLIAGSGEHRTLPLVARYADACNFLERIGINEIARKLDVLASYGAEIGRDHGDILKTTFGRLGERDLPRSVERFAALADAGVDLAMVDVPDPTDGSTYDYLAELVEEITPLGRHLPARLLAITACS